MHGPRTITLAFIVLAIASCSHSSRSMVNYAAVRSEYRAEFFADGRILVMRALNPLGVNLVPYEASLENGSVVLDVGLASSGSPGSRTYCIGIERLSLPRGWTEHVLWREPDGGLVPVTPIRVDESGRELAAQCRASAHQQEMRQSPSRGETGRASVRREVTRAVSPP
jgi:hypothetical protein